MQKIRQYDSYEEYIKHQSYRYIKPSTRNKFLSHFDTRLEKYTERFGVLSQKEYIKKDQNILCLGARFGEECLAFQHYGLKTKGIDLVPTPPLVEKGDFMKLNIFDEYDLCYTNSIDHALDLDVFLNNIHMALKKDGLLFVDIFIGNKDKLEVQVFEDKNSLIEDCKNKFKLIEVFENLPNYYGKRQLILYAFKRIS
jgi:hypothetical protein